MVNSMLEAIAAALKTEFGCEAYWKNEPQEPLKPCFVITCINPTIRQFFGKRYFSQNPFCIRYYPASEDRQQECNAVAERMGWCLEYIDAEGDRLRGSRMQSEITEGVLDFLVNYDCFLYKSIESAAMETMQSQTKVKEGN